MASETYTQIRTWLDQIFKSNGRKFITGIHANEGFKKVLVKIEELFNSKAQANGLASLDENGKVPAGQLPDAATQSYDLHFAISDETSDLTTDNDGEIEVTRAQTIVSITFYVNTAPTGSAIVVAIKKNTTTIATLTLPAASKTATITSGISDTALEVGDRVHADITQIGATVTGAGAKVGINTNLS